MQRTEPYSHHHAETQDMRGIKRMEENLDVSKNVKIDGSEVENRRSNMKEYSVNVKAEPATVTVKQEATVRARTVTTSLKQEPCREVVPSKSFSKEPEVRDAVTPTTNATDVKTPSYDRHKQEPVDELHADRGKTYVKEAPQYREMPVERMDLKTQRGMHPCGKIEEITKTERPEVKGPKALDDAMEMYGGDSDITEKASNASFGKNSRELKKCEDTCAKDHRMVRCGEADGVSRCRNVPFNVKLTSELLGNMIDESHSEERMFRLRQIVQELSTLALRQGPAGFDPVICWHQLSTTPHEECERAPPMASSEFCVNEPVALPENGQSVDVPQQGITEQALSEANQSTVQARSWVSESGGTLDPAMISVRTDATHKDSGLHNTKVCSPERSGCYLRECADGGPNSSTVDAGKIARNRIETKTSSTELETGGIAKTPCKRDLSTLHKPAKSSAVSVSSLIIDSTSSISLASSAIPSCTLPPPVSALKYTELPTTRRKSEVHMVDGGHDIEIEDLDPVPQVLTHPPTAQTPNALPPHAIGKRRKTPVSPRKKAKTLTFSQGITATPIDTRQTISVAHAPPIVASWDRNFLAPIVMPDNNRSPIIAPHQSQPIPAARKPRNVIVDRSRDAKKVPRPAIIPSGALRKRHCSQTPMNTPRKTHTSTNRKTAEATFVPASASAATPQSKELSLSQDIPDAPHKILEAVAESLQVVGRSAAEMQASAKTVDATDIQEMCSVLRLVVLGLKSPCASSYVKMVMTMLGNASPSDIPLADVTHMRSILLEAAAMAQFEVPEDESEKSVHEWQSAPKQPDNRVKKVDAKLRKGRRRLATHPEAKTRRATSGRQASATKGKSKTPRRVDSLRSSSLGPDLHRGEVACADSERIYLGRPTDLPEPEPEETSASVGVECGNSSNPIPVILRCHTSPAHLPPPQVLEPQVAIVIDDESICNVVDCGRLTSGQRVPNQDGLGQAGPRCDCHVNTPYCNVISCKGTVAGFVMVNDRFAAAGVRCWIHGGRRQATPR